MARKYALGSRVQLHVSARRAGAETNGLRGIVTAYVPSQQPMYAVRIDGRRGGPWSDLWYYPQQLRKEDTQ